jgi:hypothetical protein
MGGKTGGRALQINLQVRLDETLLLGRLMATTASDLPAHLQSQRPRSLKDDLVE